MLNSFKYIKHLCVYKQAELNEVLEDDGEETPAPTPPAVTPSVPKVTVTSHAAPPPAASSGATDLESRLTERIEMYKMAISNAKAAGETSKVRRYDRGLKVLLPQQHIHILKRL